MQKKEVRNIGEEADKKDREEKDSRRISIQEILEVEKSIWKGGIGNNIYQKALGTYDRIERRICIQKGESIFAIKGKKRGSISIHGESTIKRVYLAVKIAIDLTSLFCSKEE